ncbi:hypothetical protein AVEN_166572-1, partial [Araneus ventricosus]
KAEQQRQELKHKKQLEELRAHAESTVKELEQMQRLEEEFIQQREEQERFYGTSAYLQDYLTQGRESPHTPGTPGSEASFPRNF